MEHIAQCFPYIMLNMAVINSDYWHSSLSLTTHNPGQFLLAEVLPSSRCPSKAGADSKVHVEMAPIAA